MLSRVYNIFTLSNGLKCVHYRSKGAVGYFGVAINVGSRDEDIAKQGLAHFVEHTIFKGTRHRSRWHISNRMERIGGELNAFTSKEETVIYTVFPKGNLERAVELLSDLVGYSSFPEKELEKEKDVVIDEINSYLDSPSESVFDKFEDLIYAGSGIGHNILGDAESVRGLSSSDCRAFLDKYYTPQNMAIYIVDSSSEAKVEGLVAKYFEKYHHPFCQNNRVEPVVNLSFSKIIDDSGHQAHTIVGSRVFGKYDSRRYSLFLLNNYLGGPCMNSRLNQELRERKGYVYTVDSTVGLMSDCGLFQIYFGCDSEHIEPCKKLIRNELDRLADNRLSEKQLQAIKKQYMGQLQIGTDNKESFAISLGKSLLSYGEVHDIDWSIKQIAAVSAEDVRQTAEMLNSDNCSVLTLM